MREADKALPLVTLISPSFESRIISSGIMVFLLSCETVTVEFIAVEDISDVSGSFCIVDGDVGTGLTVKFDIPLLL